MSAKVVFSSKSAKMIEVSNSGPQSTAFSALRNLRSVADELDTVLIERTEEIEALLHCIITRSHLMLEGKHGIAKSMLAVEAFSRIKGALLFKKMLMKHTSADEIFGPMNSKLYRENAIWQHNTKGMLPEAHFFFGDEIYRAADQVLPTMLNVLNERIFYNGVEEVRCPLITAIGTSNFQTENTELEAFHDRWHVRVMTEPLGNNVSVNKMFEGFLLREEKKREPAATISLEEILCIHANLPKVRFEEDVIPLYAQLVSSVSKALGGRYISDRRKCAGLKFAQASALLDGKDTVEASHLQAARYVLVKIKDTNDDNLFLSTYSSVVGAFENSVKDRKVYAKLGRYIDKLCEESDNADKLTKEEAKANWRKVKQAISGLTSQTDQDKPTSPEGKEKHARLLTKLEEALGKLQPIVAPF